MLIRHTCSNDERAKGKDGKDYVFPASSEVEVGDEWLANFLIEKCSDRFEAVGKKTYKKPEEKVCPEKPVEVVPEEKDPLECPKCGKLCKSKIGLISHSRRCKGE